ncbi:cytochrome P450 [Xylaria arbuscula]|nr:cytochrome P450 [Xylaria arbuscula]
MEEFLDPGRPLLAAAYYGFALLASYLCIHVSYYAFLHPLSKYPGPLLASLTNGYNGYYAFKRQLHSKTVQNHLKYGPVVRQGPNKLVFSSVAALRGTIAHRSDPHAYIALGPRLAIEIVFAARDRQFHRGRRQLIGKALSERSMRIFEPKMLERVDIFLKRVLETTQNQVTSPKTVNMTESARLLGFDLAALLAFGYDLHLQTQPDNSFILPMLEAGFYWASVFIHWPLTRRFSLGLALLTVFRRLRSQYLSLVQHIISSRIKQDKDAHHDLYSIVADHLDKSGSDGIRQSELWAEATTFLPTGMVPHNTIKPSYTH